MTNLCVGSFRERDMSGTEYRWGWVEILAKGVDIDFRPAGTAEICLGMATSMARARACSCCYRVKSSSAKQLHYSYRSGAVVDAA